MKFKWFHLLAVLLLGGIMVALAEPATGGRHLGGSGLFRNVTGVNGELLYRRRVIEGNKQAFLGQDDASGDLNLATLTLTEAEKAATAANGLCQFPDDRVMTNTGQYAISDFIDRNASFAYIMYTNYGHVPATDAGLARPWDGYRYDVMGPHIAFDVNGDSMVAWVKDGSPSAYWVNYCYPTSGDSIFNKDLIDSVVTEFSSMVLALDHKPIGFMYDYFNPKSSGYYQWIAFNDSLDLDQDGLGYKSDADEQASFMAAQRYYINKMRATLGDTYFFIGNGQGSWLAPSGTVEESLDGFNMEFFPITPWASYDPVDVFKWMWETRQNPSNYRDYQYRTSTYGMPLFKADLKDSETLSSVSASACRAAALLFDGWFSYRPVDASTNLVPGDFTDATWDSMNAELGPAIGAVTAVGTPGSGVHSYTREFEGGTVSVSLDSTLSGISQITFAGLITPVGDTTAPTLTTVPTLGTGYLQFSITGGVANEPSEYRIYYYGEVNDDTGWSSTFSTTIATDVYIGNGGTYDVYIKLRDEHLNTTEFPYYLGQVYVASPIGG